LTNFEYFNAKIKFYIFSTLTNAEVLEFPIDQKARVREVFEKVCNAISVRETWFFGLAADFGNSDIIWLKSDKELRHELKGKISKEKPDEIINIRFMVKVK